MNRPADTNSARVTLVLELRHATELAIGHCALEQPRQVGVLVYVALHEDRAHFRVESDGQEQRRELECLSPQLGRVLRDGERVQVDDAVERVRILIVDPVAQGSEEAAERRVARRLHPGKDPGHLRIVRCR